MNLCVAYLVNQYPKISHTFIRREIAGLESCGVRVERFSLRLSGEDFVDEDDRSELQKTRVVLQTSRFRLALDCVAAVLTRPFRFARALALALRTGAGSDRGVLVHLIYLVEACVLLRWFSQLKVDHVHAHFGSNPAAVAMLCHVLGGPPYSITIHGPNDFDRAPFLKLHEKIARARFVMTVSSYGRSQLYRWCGREHWCKIHVLHPGVDAGFFNQPPAPIPVAPRLVCVARLDLQKGHLVLLEAVRRLIDAAVRCDLVLVGDGPERASIRARIAELQLEEYVLLAGAASGAEVRARIQAARVLVLASLAENLPTVILEAFALHRPVIATLIGGIPEVVSPGVNGWLVPAGSVEALERALREALGASVETLEKMGREGARRAAEFRSEDAARELLRRFQSGEEDRCP